MRKIFVICFVLIQSVLSALFAQVNTDTPNLSFEDGSLNGWSAYTGRYYFDNVNTSPTYGSYTYSWTPQTTASDRVKVISNNNSTYDPVIRCDLLTNPTGKSVARVGNPTICESWNGLYYLNYSAAEKLEYSFKVTENSTLLSYRLAAVLHTPPNDDHLGDQRPTFQMSITVIDDNGISYSLPCSGYSSVAAAGGGLIQNSNCTSSSAGTKRLEFFYQPWISGNIDLTAQIGKRVTITVITHDCLLNSGTNTNVAGNHSAHGYFWAETRKLALNSFSCENEDAKISAPHGFTQYEWSRSDNYPVTVPDPVNYPNVARIEKTLNFKDVIYYCKMTDANAGCGNTITLNTKIDPVVITPDFTFSAVDAGKIQFTNNSTITNDNITSYFWDFGDGDTDNQANPTHTYNEFKQFTVKLTVTSSQGCSKTITKNVLPTKELIADIFPPANLGYNGQTKDFTATVNITGLQMNIDYFIRYTNKPGTPFYNSYTAPSNVGDYNATFELSFQSALKYFMNSVPSKDFTITKAPVTLTINNVTKTYGQTISLQREGFTSSMNPLYAGDKIYELNVKSGGLPDTASVKVYEIKADTAFGFGVSNYDITFVQGTLTVNPKTLEIRAIDKSKTYGDLIIPTGREFFITPGSMIGRDSVRTVDVSCAGFPASAPVGTETISLSNATGYRLNNYSISYSTASLDIAKKKLTISANPQTKVYGTSYTFTKADYTVDKTLFVGTDSITTLDITSGATVFNAPVNDYPVIISNPTGPGLNNYDIKLINNTFKVTLKPVSITADNQTKEYGDVFAFTGREFSTNPAMIQGDTILAVTLKSTGVSQTAPIGLYDIVPSQAYGNGTLNYQFSYVPGKMSVIKKQLIATLTPPANLNYNATAKSFTATVNVSSLVMNSDYFIRYTNRPGTPAYNSTIAPANAGDYTATFEATPATLQNYQIDNIPTQDFTIQKVPVTITIDNASKTYGESYTLAGTSFRSSLQPLYGTDNISSVNLTCDAVRDTASVGIYPVNATQINGNGLNNYTITYVNGQFTVSAKPLQIKAVNRSKTYGDLIVPTGREFFITPGSMIGQDSVRTVDVNSVGFPANASVGTETISISNAVGNRLNNYDISYIPATLNIAKKGLTIAAKPQTKVYGTSYTFTKADYTVDKTLFVGTDSITTLDITSGATVFNAPVNDYPVILSNLTGPGLSNYDIKLINNTFRVTLNPVTITAVNQTKQYGDVFAFTGREFTTNISLVQGDTILAVTLKSNGISQTASIGTYDILPSQAYGNGTLNYSFTYQSGVLEVVKKPFTATLSPPANLNYNATAKNFTATVSVSSLVMNSDYFIRYTNRPGTPAYNSTNAPTNAGDYTATFDATPATLQNYQIDNPPTLDFTIEKVPVTITVDNASKTYGESYTLAGTSFRSSLQPLYGTDNISSVNLTSDAVRDTASVGIYPVVAAQANGNGLDNYTITYVNGQFTVSAKPLLIKAINLTKTYGDVLVPAGSEFSVDTKQLVGSDAVNSVALSSTGFAATATVGSYPVLVSGATGVRLHNYQITYTDGLVQINKKQLSVTALDQAITYGDTFAFTGREFSKSAQLVGNDTIYSANISSGATATKAAAGSYAITISGLTGVGFNNYDITLNSGTFTVLRKSVTVTANDVQKQYGTALTFNGNEFTTDIPLVAGDNLSYASLTSPGTPALSPVGEYDIDISQAYGPGSMNYNFSYIKGKLTVVKKQLIATLIAPTYLGYNAQTKDFTATLNVAGLEQNRDYELRYESVPDNTIWNSNAAPKAAGDYKVTFVLIGQSPDRYYMDNTPISNFTITKAPINITADNATKTYGDRLTILQDAFKSDMKPLYGSDNITGVQFDCSGLSDTASVGYYQIMPKLAVGNGIANYDIRYLPGELIVLQKSITVKAVNVTKIYGDNYVSDGTGFYVDPSVLVGKDVITKAVLVSAGFAKTAVIGSYPVSISSVEGTRTGNYAFTFIDGTLTVGKRKVTVTAANLTKTYGDSYTFKPTDYSYDRTRFVGNDSIQSVALSSQAVAFKASVGTYPVTILSTTGVGLSNYDIETVSGQFTVNPLPLTITANNASKQYGTLYTFNGNEFTTDKPLVKGDTILYVLIKSDGAAETASVRDYDITASMAYGVGIQNYTITYISGRLSVGRRSLTASLVPPVYLVYNAQPKVVTAVLSATGLTLNTDYFIRYSNNSGYDGLVPPVNAGTYTARFELSSLASQYYQVNNVAHENFTITRAPLTVTASNATKTYGERLNLRSDAFSTDMKPLFGSDKIFTVDFKCAGSADTAMVKTYSIIPENPSGNGLDNYNITYIPGELTVIKKSITLKAPDLVKTYGDTLIISPTSFYIDPYALVGNDKVTAATFESDGTRKSSTIGTYPLKITKATGRRLDNYNLNFADGNIQVIKKQLTVTARRIIKEYGTEYIFRGDEFEVDKNELVGNDFVHSVKLNSLATNKKASVGEYVVSVTDVSGFNLENYTIKMQAGVMAITPLALIITPGNIEKEFGDTYSFMGTEFSLSRPMLNNDTISYVFMKSNGTNYAAAIGEYDITASQAVGVGSLNYTISFGTGKLKVIQKTLHVAAGSFVKEYGEKDPELRFSVQDKNGVEYQPSLFSGNVVRQTGETPGTYPVRKGTLSITPSYTFTFTEGKLDIKKALPFIDPELRTDNGNQIMADVVGTTNGDTPKGKFTITCPETGFTGEASLVNGQGITPVAGLPNHQTEVLIEYSGDDNYLPTSKKMTIYALNYHVNGGTMLSTVAHYDGGQSIKFETPTRDENYRFEGWFETPDFGDTEVRRIPAGTYRDVDVYAKWSASYIDLYIVVLFNQILAVANPQNREILYTATYKWFKDGVQLDGSKQYIGFEKFVPSGKYRVEIYPENGTVITLELAHQATPTKSMAYPNPMKVSSSLNVESPLIENENTVTDVVTATGQKAGNVVVERKSGKYILRGFSKPGVYFVRLSVNGEIRETHKIIVEN